MEPKFNIRLTLQKPEAEALARMAVRELRSLQGQACYMLREALIASGELSKPDTSNTKSVIVADGTNEPG